LAFSARLRQLRSGKRDVGEALAENALQGQRESGGVIAVAVVETERLLIEIAEQVKRFDAHVGALDGALLQAPEILQPVGVDGAIDVRLGMVDDVVGVVGLQRLVGRQRIGVDGAARLDVLEDVRQ